MKKSFLLLFSLVASTTLLSQINFLEQASNLGCGTMSYGDGFLGGGISFFDYNSDGWDDITVSSEEGQPVRFFKNNGGIFFEETFNINDALYETKTVQWVDFDNDADYDLFVTSNIEGNKLYENDGSLQFTDITTSAGLVTTDHRTFGASWGDYNKDGFLDLFINSRHYDNAEMPNILYKNNGDGTFTNVNATTGIPDLNYFSFCAAFFDYNNDGWQDIYIANDRDPENLLYKNNGDGTFTEVGAVTGTNVSINAMSTTIGDYDHDGFQDIYVTNTIEGNVFYKNNGDGTFTDIAASNGTLFESVGWGAVFLDADNDTDLDLYVSGQLDGDAGLLPSAFYENAGSGMYTIPTNAGFDDDTAQSFGNAIGDINNDGLPDITVLNYEPDAIYVWENTNTQNHNWLKVKLQGTESNRQGIGSTIEISVNGQKQYQYTMLGEGYLGQNSSYEFFGIGAATSVDYVKIHWLSGIVDYIENPAINTHHTYIEGENILGTQEFSNEEIHIFPNPASETVTITFPEVLAGSMITLRDITGRTMFQEKNASVLTQLEVGHLSNGIYMVSIENGETKLSEKIIVE